MLRKFLSTTILFASISMLAVLIFYSPRVKANSITNFISGVGDFLFGTTEPAPNITNTTTNVTNPTTTVTSPITTTSSNSFTDQELYAALARINLPESIIAQLRGPQGAQGSTGPRGPAGLPASGGNGTTTTSTEPPTIVYNTYTTSSGGGGSHRSSSDWRTSGDDIFYTKGDVGVESLTSETAGSLTEGVVKTTIAEDRVRNMGIAMGPDGFARIAYISGDSPFSYPLEYIVCNDEDCTDPAVTELDDATPGALPGSQILTLGPDNLARIVYHDDDGSLQLVRCTNETCSTKVTTAVVDDGDDHGYYGQQVVMGDDGFPRVAYTNCDADNDLHFVRFDGDDSVSSDVNLTDVTGVSNDCTSWSEVSVAIGPDHFARIIIADYLDDGQLKMLRCNDAGCSNPTVDTLVAGDNRPGYWGTVIKFGSDDLPRISYVDGDSPYALHHLVCNDTDCTAPTITDLVNTSGNTTNGIGMDLRTGNLASISYDSEDRATHIINCSDDACSTYEDLEIDTFVGMRRGGPLFIGSDNLPRIAYNDYASLTVKFARLQSIDGQDVIAGSNLGESPSSFGQIYGTRVNAEQIYLNGSPLPWIKSGDDIYFADGNVGIDTISPLAKLSVDGTASTGPSTTDKGIAYINAASNQVGLSIGNYSSSPYGMWLQSMSMLSGENYTYPLILNPLGGNVGIHMTNPSVALDVTGDIEYTGTITDVSDRRLKENISDYTGALDIISNLQAKNYNMIGSNKEEVGFLAQDVQNLFPSATSIIDPTNGYLGVSYVSLVPVISQALRELNIKVDNLASLSLEDESWFDKLTVKLGEWFADATNGITDMFANVFYAKEKICVDGECLTKSDIKNLLDLVKTNEPEAGSSNDETPAVVETPESQVETPAPPEEVTTTPEPEPETPAEEETPPPEPEITE